MSTIPPSPAALNAAAERDVLDVSSRRTSDRARVADRSTDSLLGTIAAVLARPESLPNPAAVQFVRKREMNAERQPPRKGLVEVVGEVRRQDRDAFVLFHLLQQVADFEVGIAVV